MPTPHLSASTRSRARVSDSQRSSRFPRSTSSRLGGRSARLPDGWPPRWLTAPPAGLGTRGDEAAEFIESYCRITKESVGGRAGDLIVLRPWQRHLLDALLTENRAGLLHYRHALIGIARKNGKSAWSSALALHALLMGETGAEIYSCAGDKEQARIVFGVAKATVEMDPELRSLTKVYRDAIEVPKTGAVYRVLSSEAYTKEGLSPNLVIFDEVHVQPDDELWSVMELAAGARREPLMLGITTAGVRTNSRGEDSLCYRLYRHGQEVCQGLVDDPTFFFAWWEPSAGISADHRDPAVWAEANPGLGDIVAREDFESVINRVPEPEFRSKRTNVFVAASETWLPYGAWDACLDDEARVLDGQDVILGFDGSYNNDSTAIVLATVGSVPLIVPVRVWERPEGAPSDWSVPIEDVEDELRRACKRWRVREVVCDPYRWARSMQVLLREGLPVVEYPQSPERMVPATQRFYEAALNGGLRHDGDRTLARHIANCVLKVDSRGSRIVKANRSSSAKIDLAVAAVMAHDRAAGRPRAGAGWLTYIKSELARQEQPAVEVREPTPDPAPQRAPRRTFLLGQEPPSAMSPRACKHHWFAGACAHCGAPFEN